MLSREKRKFMAKHLGADMVEDLEAQLADLRGLAKSLNLSFKEQKSSTATPTAPAATRPATSRVDEIAATIGLKEQGSAPTRPAPRSWVDEIAEGLPGLLSRPTQG